MPKKLVVKQDTNSVNGATCAYNACVALAEAIGSSVTQKEGSSSDKKIYEVSFSSLGYPDLKFRMQDIANNTSVALSAIISESSAKQLPYLDFNVYNQNDRAPKNNAMSCYVVRDPNNDTVIIGIHNGRTETAEVGSSGAGYLSLFMGRDENGNVLWGSGLSNIQLITDGLKTIDSRVREVTSQHQNLVTSGLPSDVLQFVKMRNYLSEGYPEMKTAYVTTLRTTNVSNRANLSFYADGALWGYGGFGDYKYAVFEIDPWVKY